MLACTNGTPTLESKKYYTKRQASAYSTLSLRSLDYAICRGHLKAYKVGRKVLITGDDLDAFLRRNLVGADLDDVVDQTLAALEDK